MFKLTITVTHEFTVILKKN